MKNLNFITDSIKTRTTVTAKDFTAWEREMKKSLKPLELAKLNSEERRTAIQDRITLAKSCVGELKAANSALKSKSGKALLKVQPKDLKKAGEDAIKLLSNEMIELAKEEARNFNWSKATKTLNEAIDFAGAKRNGLITVKPDATLFLYRAKAQYYHNGIKPALIKGLYEALKIHPKHEALTHVVSHYEILNGNYDAAFKVIQQIPRNTSSRSDTIIRYMLQPHTDHGGLEAFHRSGFGGDPIDHDFGRGFPQPRGFGGDPIDPPGGYPGGIAPGGVFPDRPFDEDPLADFNGKPDLGGFLGDLPLSNITNGKPLGFPCNFYTYHYSLFSNDDLLVTMEGIKAVRNSIGSSTGIDTTSPDYQYKLFLLTHKNWIEALDYIHHKNYDAAIKSLNIAQENAIRILLRSKVSCIDPQEWERGDVLKISSITQATFRSILDYKFNYSSIEKNLNESHIFNTLLAQRNSITDINTLYINDWLNPKSSENVQYGLYIYNRLEGKLFSPFFLLAWGAVKDDTDENSLAFPIGDVGAIDLNYLISRRRIRIDFPLILLSCVFIPFAKIEAYRFSKQYERAIQEINRLIGLNDGGLEMRYFNNKPILVPVAGYNLLNPSIEYPFLKIMKAQILMELADKQYKTGESKNNLIRNDNPKGLEAKNTYDEVIKVFDNWPTYNSRVNRALLAYQNNRNAILKIGSSYKHTSPIFIREMERLGNPVPDTNILTSNRQLEAQALNKAIHIANITSINQNRTALLPERNYPWKRVIQWIEGSQNALSNPVIYAIILDAISKLKQIGADLNYLGYPDDYVPPWKFFYLLDRARYYTGQAKNLQRDYLNFLSNAEQEQFQEMGAGQSVSLERMNVNVENARVDQANAGLEVANQSNELAQLQTTNAQQRKDNFDEYDEVADTCDMISLIATGASAVPSMVAGGGAGASAGASIDTFLGFTDAGFFTIAGGTIGALAGGGQQVSQISQLIKEGFQRDMEQKNLQLAIAEATQAANVAVAQVGVAEVALTVSNLQAQAALMRLDFALDNYEFLRNRLTSAEMWFRLTHAIREVANTYLRRAIEMSFLAEQVYEYMIDKRINVVRFDYDNDELGAMLGADYLQADLDYLESHLIFTQREKQQKIKCVISMARDLPQALQELSENESAIIAITLEYLERRFPGVYNMKVSTVEMQPIAIMDPARFNVEMTFMGSGTIRTKTYPVNTDGSGEITANDFGPYGTSANQWIPLADIQFPVKSLLCPVETCVFTGLTTAEDSANFQSFTTQQKKAFEDCPAAASWLVDMSMTENKVLPGSLADMVITLYLTGFYDSDLKTHVERETANETRVVNRVMSARSQFSDQYFSFERTGKIELAIAPGMLSINDRIGELKQLGAYFMPAASDINYTRFSSQEFTKFKVSNAHNLSIVESAPSFRIRKKSGGTNKELTTTIQLLKPLDSTNGDKVEIFTDESNSPIPNSGTNRQREADFFFLNKDNTS